MRKIFSNLRGRPRRAQSLIEILIGLGIGVILIAGAAAVIVPSLRTSTQVGQIQIKSQLANEMLDNARGWATGNWNAVLSLSTGTANPYYFNSAASSFSVVTGTEAVAAGSSTYLRYFYLSDVYRDSNGNITSTVAASNYDPSTKLLTVGVATPTSTIVTSTFNLYLTRITNNAFSQVSWAGGSGQNNPTKLSTTTYASAWNMTVNATGSIQLSPPPGGLCSQ